MKPISWLLMLLLLVAAAGCGLLRRGMRQEPDLVGQITQIQSIHRDEVVGRILVASQVTRAEGQFTDQYWVTLRDKTPVLQQTAGAPRPVSFDELQTGQRVQVWFAGPVAESFPMQVTAQQVTILPGVP